MAQQKVAAEAPRVLYGFALTSFFNDVASEMAYWILPAFVVSLGGGPAQLGIIEGIAEAMASVSKLWGGKLADSAGRRKPIVAAGYAVANVVKPLLSFATAWWQVLAVRFADRTAKGLRGASRDVMLADETQTSKLGAAYGFVQAADSAGAIVGPLCAWLLLRQAHWTVRSVFLAAAVPGALSVLAITLLVKEKARERIGGAHAQQGSGRLPASFWVVLAIVCVFSLGASSDMFLVLRAKEAGIAVALAPLLGLAFNTVYTFASWPAGALSDRVPRHVVAALGYLVYAAVYAVFAWAPVKLGGTAGRASLWAAMAFYGLFYSLTEPVLKALVVGGVAKEVRGRAVGVYSFAVSVCILISSAATGWLWKTYGGTLPLGVSAGLALAAALMMVAAGAPPAEKVA